MSSRVNLVLLYGGKSGEHEISLRSAASVLANLDPERFNIIPVGMDKKGCFYKNDYHELLAYPDELPVSTQRSCSMDSLLKNGRLAIDAQVIFPVVHGPLYEDGCLQGLLELADVAYVGSDVLSSAIGMDKDMARRLLVVENINTTKYRCLSWHATVDETRAFCENVSQELGWPLFVKPCSMGSSVGIHKAYNMDQLLLAVADARRYDKEILVEAFVQGREIELAVLEHEKPNQRPHVSLPGEIRVHHADGFYSYAAKYLESETNDLLIPAPLDDELVNCLQQMAATIFMALKCRGMARVDFFVDDQNNKIYFNEINTLPGFTSISMYPKLWHASGLDYPALLNRLIDLAFVHQHCRKQLVTHYQ